MVMTLPLAFIAFMAFIAFFMGAMVAGARVDRKAVAERFNLLYNKQVHAFTTAHVVWPDALAHIYICILLPVYVYIYVYMSE